MPILRAIAISGLLFLVAASAMSVEWSESERRDMEKARQRVAIVDARMLKHVSLPEDVKAYLDFEETDYRPNIWDLIKYYGEDAWPELAKQAAARSQWLVRSILFSGSETRHPALRDLALANLGDKVAGEYALVWCALNRDALTDAQRANAVERVWKNFEAERCRSGFYLVEMVAVPRDAPRLRALYEKYLRKADDLFPIYGIKMTFTGYRLRNQYTTHSDILGLLARLGEARAVADIRAALAAKAPPEQRMWGAVMAAYLKDRRYLPLLAEALNDKRPGDEWICRDVNPEIGDVGAWCSAYTRVCDVALRAIHQIVPPEKPWQFLVSPASPSPAFFDGWMLSEFKYREKVSQRWERLDEHSRVDVVNTRLVVGYTDEQLAFGRQYAAELLKAQPAPTNDAKPPASAAAPISTAR